MNEIEIIITSKDRTGPGVDSAVRGQEKLKKSTDRSSESIERQGKTARSAFEEIGRHVEAAGRKADAALDGMGTSFDHTDQGAARLKDSIKGIDDTIKKLTESFGRTGNMSFLGDIDALQRDKAKLERIGKTLFEPVAKAAEDTGRRIPGLLTERINSGLSSASDVIAKNPVIAGAVAAGIIVGTPLISAALASAVELGLGAGVIAGGIVLAAKDSRVADAWGDVADRAMEGFKNSAAVFVEPVRNAALRIGDALDSFQPRIERAFARMAPLVDNLADGVAGLLDKIGPGFDKAMAAAGPFIALLAEHLPELGDALSSFFEGVANAGPGAQLFFDDFLGLIEDTIVALGYLAEYGAKVYEVFTAIGQAVTGLGQAVTGDFKGALDNLGGAWDTITHIGGKFDDTIARAGQSAVEAATKITTAAPSFDELAKRMNATAETADTLAGKMSDRIFNALLTADRAVLQINQSHLNLKETLNQNGLAIDRTAGTISMYTEKGIANRNAILGVVQANIAQYDTMIKSGMAAEDAAEAYRNNTGALELQMYQAGYTQQQIQGLIGKYKNVPDRVNTDIAMRGLQEAIAGLDETLRLINHLPPRKDINVVTHYSETGNPPSGHGFVKFNAHGGIVGAAGGGPRSNLTMVGEQGPELVRLPFGSTVMSNPDTRRALAARGGDGATQVMVSAAPGAEHAMVEWMIKWLRFDIRTAGGGDVQDHLGAVA